MHSLTRGNAVNFEDTEFQKAMNSFMNAMSELTDNDDYILAENTIKEFMHERSPMSSEPVNCVVWVKNTEVYANDYNPNSVAPPEMELLRHSISEDGYTQPIVTWKESGGYQVIDGFHRNRVGKECKDIQSRVKGYLPIVKIRQSQTGKNDRMASTIRHNRARGKHKVESMSEIVIELKRRNWTDAKIAKNLGMDEDEVLRLCQITGMAELFADETFSKSWDIGFEEDLDVDMEFEDDSAEN